MEKKRYIVRGDHPTFRRQDYIAIGVLDLISKLHELHRAGYEIEIEMYKENQS